MFFMNVLSAYIGSREQAPSRRAAEKRDDPAAIHVWMAPAWQEKM
jgi:hypothetical protein